ncbi:MAG TPA: molybdenum cofactor guanylyltransferase [Gemmatimonadales bacterium]|nr:molybdenum cofactor guanylyltransferase [Gemmatimonadales bacterium]
MVAGGAASRYGGKPKGLFEVGGRRILDRAIESLERATGEPPTIIANAPDAGSWRPDLRVVPDVLPGQGALGGILTAVERLAPVLCVAWDMPFVPAALLAALAALLDGADAALPESDSRRGVEPLCAAYGSACGPAIRAALERGEARAIGFHRDVRVTRLPREAVLQYGDPDVLFFNVNTADDLARAERMCRSLDSSR